MEIGDIIYYQLLGQPIRKGTVTDVYYLVGKKYYIISVFPRGKKLLNLKFPAILKNGKNRYFMTKKLWKMLTSPGSGVVHLLFWAIVDAPSKLDKVTLSVEEAVVVGAQSYTIETAMKLTKCVVGTRQKLLMIAARLGLLSAISQPLTKDILAQVLNFWAISWFEFIEIKDLSWICNNKKCSGLEVLSLHLDLLWELFGGDLPVELLDIYFKSVKGKGWENEHQKLLELGEQYQVCVYDCF